jgi:SAM-dependent methyltransferase
MDYDKTNMPAAYDAGRSYSPAVLARWLDVISRRVAKSAVSEILDIGCGTGRYSTALAAHFDARVVAIDPSEKMLAQARKKAMERVSYERASGESLPLPDGSVDMVFMSMVFHHFDDPDRILTTLTEPSGNVSGCYTGMAPFVYVRVPEIASEHISTFRSSREAVPSSTTFCNLKHLSKRFS